MITEIDFRAISEHPALNDPRRAKYSTQRAVSALLLLAEKNNGIVKYVDLEGLFGHLGLNSRGRERAFNVASIFNTGEDGQVYVPIEHTTLSVPELSAFIYNATRSGNFVRGPILSLFDKTPELSAAEIALLQRRFEQLSHDYDRLYDKWVQENQENLQNKELVKRAEDLDRINAQLEDDRDMWRDVSEKYRLKGIDLSNRLTRLSREADSFTKIVLRMTRENISTDDDDDTTSPSGVSA